MPRKTFREMLGDIADSRRELRGTVKLRAALDAFEALGIGVEGRVALDVGASTGGFVTELLARGVTRVYAVDAGHGQLLGSLRQDPRVVNLEATNVGDLTTELISEPIDLVTVDVSYLTLRDAVAQLDRIDLAPGAELVGLVKPMFELKRAEAPVDRMSLDEALTLAVEGAVRSGWVVLQTIDSPVVGANGAPELFLAARRAGEVL